MGRRNGFESFPQANIPNQQNYEYKKSTFWEQIRAFPDILAIGELDAGEILDIIKQTFRINLREQVDSFNFKLLVADINNIVGAFRAGAIDMATGMLTEFLFEKIGKRFPIANIGDFSMDLIYQLVQFGKRKKYVRSRQNLRNDVERQRKNLTVFNFKKSRLGSYFGYKLSHITRSQGSIDPINTTLNLGGQHFGIPIHLRIQLFHTLLSPMGRGLDCIRFAHSISGKNITLNNLKPLNPIYPPNLKAGNIITFTKSLESFSRMGTCGNEFHFATYIGKGLYISKPGKTAPIIITDFNNLKNGASEGYNHMYLVQ